MKTFADLIAPITPEVFFTEYFGRKPLHIPASGEAGKRKVLPWADFNAMLSQTSIWTDKTLRLVTDTQGAASTEYCEPVRGSDGVTVMRPNPAKVRMFVAMGASIIANHMQELSPGIADTCEMLGETFGAEIGANAYASFKNVKAFGTHFDTHDVFAIHTEGEKVWKVWSNRADNPLKIDDDTPELRRWFEQSRGSLLMEVTMRPGDVLYLPRGWYHDALAGSEASLHLTLSVTPMHAAGLLPIIQAMSEAQADFRAWVPPATANGGKEIDAWLDQFADTVAAFIRSPALRDEVEMAQRRMKVKPGRYDLPERGRLTGYFRTAAPAPRFEGPVGVAMDFALSQRGFYTEELLARFHFVDPEALQEAVEACVKAGALEKA